MPAADRLGGLVRAAAVLATLSAGHTWLNTRRMLTPSVSPPPTTEPIAVCVPARQEEGAITELVADLRAQQGVAHLSVYVLDDASTDATTEAARRAIGDDARFHLHRSDRPPPPGWLGKPAACDTLSVLACSAPRPPQVLVFLDADLRLRPHALAAAVHLLRQQHLGLLSPWPVQRAGTLLERLVQPLQQWSWLSTLPLQVAQRSLRPAFAAANGQLLVCDAGAYQAAGGHRGVAGAVLEDLELARAVRRAGYRTAPADGSRLASCRMYTTATELRAGYRKSLWTAFGSPAGSAAVLTALGFLYVLPAAAGLFGQGRTRAWGVAGWGSGVVSRVLAARATGTPGWPDSVAHPVSVLMLAALVLDSHRGHRRGTLRWKGRALP